MQSESQTANAIGVGSNPLVVPHRMTFQKAFDEERKSWRWATMPRETEALVIAFCACVHLRMKGSSMDEVMRHNVPKLSDGGETKP